MISLYNSSDSDSNLVWNPAISAYVDRSMYERALAVQDPSQKGYKGVKPNYGGGLTKLDLNTGKGGIGSTDKHMKKLTTVLSKN